MTALLFLLFILICVHGAISLLNAALHHASSLNIA